MMRWVSILTLVALAGITVVSPRFGFIAVPFALGAFAIVFWLSVIVELLRVGPRAQRDWWIAALAVVVVLGPLGALVYRLAAPDLSREGDASLYPK